MNGGLQSNTEAIELLREIARNTRPKSSMQLIVTGKKSEMTVTYDTPIRLNQTSEYEVALFNLETYFSFPNVDKSNQNFVYSHDNGATWTELSIPEGAYELRSINKLIKQLMRSRGHAVDRPISFAPNISTLKTEMDCS